jgi:hypothetical protein
MEWLSLEMQNMVQTEKSGSVNKQQSHISSLSISGKEMSPLSTKNCQRDTSGKKIKQKQQTVKKERHSI